MPDLPISAQIPQTPGSYLQSPEFKKLIPYLLSGGAGAAVGAFTSGRRRKEKGESRMGYLGRILGNAAIGGGLGAGAHFALDKGIDSLNGVTDPGAPVSAEVDEGPAETIMRRLAFSPVVATGTGVGALALTHGRKHIGAGNTKTPLAELAKLTDKRPGDLEFGTSPNAMGKLISELPPDVARKADKFRQAAGLPSALNDMGQLSKRQALFSWIRRKGMATLGQTNPRMIARGTLGLTAAGIPAVLGALLTSERPAQ